MSDVIVNVESTTVSPVVQIINDWLMSSAITTYSPTSIFNGVVIPFGQLSITTMSAYVDITMNTPPPPIQQKKVGKSFNILSTTTTEVINTVGNPFPAAGYYGPTTGLHTIMIKTSNFRGTLYIEGTLENAPTQSDWFPITINGQTSFVFPTTSMAQWGQTETIGGTFFCNCLYIRARIDRSTIISPLASPYQISLYGNIDTVLLNY